MRLYTGIFTIRDSTEILQAEAANHIDAIRDMIGKLPHDDAFDFSETDGDLLTATISGQHKIELAAVTGRTNVWYWIDGARMDDRIDAYIILTSGD